MKRRFQLMMGILVGSATPAMGQDSERPVSDTAVAKRDAIALAASVPPATREDLDTTITPCQDFAQYATGQWAERTQEYGYRLWQFGQLQIVDTIRNRIPLPLFGPRRTRAGEALRQLVVQAPALALTTDDPALRAVGRFYGSCLVDTSGAAPGVAGDTGRARYCFRATRQYLDRALFEMLMEYIWPPMAREASRAFEANVKAAANTRFEASTALTDSIKQALQAVTNRVEPSLFGGEKFQWRDRRYPAGVRGPSTVPFTGEEVAATWVYRDYTRLILSPADFQANIARLRAMPDPVPPVLPGRPPHPTLLDMLLDENKQTEISPGVQMSLNELIMPLVDGRLDLGVWYGVIGPIVGHEFGHEWDGDGKQPLARASKAELDAFAAEQFQEQLQHFGHPFMDAFGVRVAYDAFKRAQRTWPWPHMAIDGFTPEQRFFLGVAWGFRGGPVRINPLDAGPTRWRVFINGALSAMPAFARAFSCASGGPMTGAYVWYQAPWRGVVLSPRQRDELAFDYERTLEWLARKLLLGKGRSIAEMAGGTRVDATALLAEEVLTVAQAAAFAARRQVYDAAREQLLGAPGQRAKIGTPTQLYRLLGQELGEVRMVLTPEQRTTFDSSAKALTQKPPSSLAWQGIKSYRIEIPGVQ